MRKESHFRREESPFLIRRPQVGNKTIPVVTIDNGAQDDQEVQELTERAELNHKKDELVVLARPPRQPGDEVTLLSAQRSVKHHQPAHLCIVKSDESEPEEEEGGDPGSPLYTPPEILDDPEYGQPSDPLQGCYSPPCPATTLAVAREDQEHPPDQTVEAESVSSYNPPAPEEKADSDTQENGDQLPEAAAGGSVLKAALNNKSP